MLHPRPSLTAISVDSVSWEHQNLIGTGRSRVRVARQVGGAWRTPNPAFPGAAPTAADEAPSSLVVSRRCAKSADGRDLSPRCGGVKQFLAPRLQPTFLSLSIAPALADRVAIRRLSSHIASGPHRGGERAFGAAECGPPAKPELWQILADSHSASGPGDQSGTLALALGSQRSLSAPKALPPPRWRMTHAAFFFPAVRTACSNSCTRFFKAAFSALSCSFSAWSFASRSARRSVK